MNNKLNLFLVSNVMYFVLLSDNDKNFENFKFPSLNTGWQKTINAGNSVLNGREWKCLINTYQKLAGNRQPDQKGNQQKSTSLVTTICSFNFYFYHFFLDIKYYIVGSKTFLLLPLLLYIFPLLEIIICFY